MCWTDYCSFPPLSKSRFSLGSPRVKDINRTWIFRCPYRDNLPVFFQEILAVVDSGSLPF